MDVITRITFLDENGEMEVDVLNLRARAHYERTENPVVCTCGFESGLKPARPVPLGEHVFEKAWRSFREKRGLDN